jgi:hypothetical protein
MRRARLGDESGVKTGIFAGEIELTKNSGRGDRLSLGGTVLFGLSRIEGKNEGGGGYKTEAHYNF